MQTVLSLFKHVLSSSRGGHRQLTSNAPYCCSVASASLDEETFVVREPVLNAAQRDNPFCLAQLPSTMELHRVTFLALPVAVGQTRRTPCASYL